MATSAWEPLTSTQSQVPFPGPQGYMGLMHHLPAHSGHMLMNHTTVGQISLLPLQTTKFLLCRPPTAHGRAPPPSSGWPPSHKPQLSAWPRGRLVTLHLQSQEAVSSQLHPEVTQAASRLTAGCMAQPPQLWLPSLCPSPRPPLPDWLSGSLCHQVLVRVPILSLVVLGFQRPSKLHVSLGMSGGNS